MSENGQRPKSEKDDGRGEVWTTWDVFWWGAPAPPEPPAPKLGRRWALPLLGRKRTAE
ncbi:MAG: hypothetical protein ICV74_04110 [Thermoleophilia bacterium]|nr:hypothetical protein [Thermoleophilia bacterium]